MIRISQPGVSLTAPIGPSIRAANGGSWPMPSRTAFAYLGTADGEVP